MADNPIDREMKSPSFLDRVIRFCLENKLVITLITIVIVAWGIMVAPFDWELGNYPRDPVPVDAIPDIGENQQIVFTEWMGRSPQDVEDQVTYPLTVALLGTPGVRTVRSYSMFGFSTIYVIFKDKVDFYWSRSRVLEKLNSLPPGTVPEGVRPALGPDATALGQVFFTLSLGMGAMVIYGSYMKRTWGIPLNALACSLGNTSASILAGFAIFPAAFALGFSGQAQGSEAVGLTFTVLPRL